MNDLYLARLTAEPPGAMPEATVTDPNPPIHIHPHPNPSDPSQPIPIHFPNIYVHPYPPVPPQPPNNPSVHHPEAAPSNRVKQEGTSHISSREPKINLGPWEMTRPHPLLWICFFLSLLAVVLEFPKGSFPTFTGRHKALRLREKLVSERLVLLNQLSTFLPPPLAQLVAPDNLSLTPWQGGDGVNFLPNLKFWNGYGALSGEDGRWWSIEDLGQGASVVRSRDGDDETEVWVLRVGEGEHGEERSLLNALTHSLLLRDRLLSELTTARATPCPPCPPTSLPTLPPASNEERMKELKLAKVDDEEVKMERTRRRERDQARERELDEREKNVGKREQWVLEEMKGFSDKVHAQATELSLEVRITDRLKSYQRELEKLKDDRLRDEL